MRTPDLRRILHIERGAYRFPWSEGIFRDCLQVGYCCWVLERAELIEGYGIMQIAGPEAHILNLCVDSASHRLGFGRQMLRCLMGVAHDHKADTMLLEVRPSNAAARRLYRSEGFRAVGTRRGYYPSAQGREDALILSRPLP